MECSSPGSSVHGIFQARILEWVAYPFSRGSSQPKNRTWVSSIAGRVFPNWAMREAWWCLVFINPFFLSYHSQKCPHLGLTVSLEFSFTCAIEFSASVSLTHRVLFNPMHLNLWPPDSSHPCLQQPFSRCTFHSTKQSPHWGGGPEQKPRPRCFRPHLPHPDACYLSSPKSPRRWWLTR